MNVRWPIRAFANLQGVNACHYANYTTPLCGYELMRQAHFCFEIDFVGVTDREENTLPEHDSVEFELQLTVDRLYS